MMKQYLPKKIWYRGIRYMEYIYNGNVSDPEIKYKGYLFNMIDIDNAIYYDFIADNPEYADKEIPDELFNKYAQEHKYLIKEYMLAAIESGSATKY